MCFENPPNVCLVIKQAQFEIPNYERIELKTIITIMDPAWFHWKSFMVIQKEFQSDSERVSECNR